MSSSQVFSMSFIPTELFRQTYPKNSLDQFVNSGWTWDQLQAEGLAEPFVEPEPAPLLPPITGHGELPKNMPLRDAVPNVFGIQDLSVVTLAYQEAGRLRRMSYPNGWSYEQQILYVAEMLYQRRMK